MGGKYSKPDHVPNRWYDDYVAAMPSQAGKHIAITGCTSGTGFDAAKAIVSRGGNVIALNRPSERAVSALAAIQAACKDGATATHVDCDLQDFASVRSAAAEVSRKVQDAGLNCLLNNAGACLHSFARGIILGFFQQN
jgi:NAD(P)-dependent dehydrogenase (short-subunit alcohol dehydrogenase family)